MASWLNDSLPEVMADALLGRGFVRNLNAGETLYVEGSQSDSAYVVLQGLVRLSKVSPNGNQALVAVRGKGDLVGQHSALDGHRRAATARGLTTAHVLCILRPHFVDALENSPDLAQMVMVGLCAQVRDTVTHIVELLDENVTVLVARRLVQLATEPRLDPLRTSVDGTIVIEALSQSDLAGWAGVSDRSAGVALREFRESGLIATSRMRVEIHDLDRLRERAGPGFALATAR